MTIIAWLVGAHPILSGVIDQPSEFPQREPFGIGWDWSHILDGNYSGRHEPPIHLIPFLPAENREAILRIACDMEVEPVLEDFLTDPQMEAIMVEMAGVPERFLELYRRGSSVN